MWQGRGLNLFFTAWLDPDFELTGWGGGSSFALLVLPAFLHFVISSFF